MEGTGLEAHAVALALNLAALGLGVVALAVAIVAWWQSRAKKIRDFEDKITQLARNINARVEQVESAFPVWTSKMEGLADEAHELYDRSDTLRKRASMERKRAEGGGPERDGARIDPSAPRSVQLAQVRARLGGV